MPTKNEITYQQELLQIHRYTLSIFLRQLAQHSSLYAPPGIFHGIRDVRSEIHRIKRILRSWNVRVEDHPDDDEDGVVYDEAQVPLQTPSAQPFIDKLSKALLEDTSMRPLRSRTVPADFIGMRETMFAVEAVALVNADNLSESDIVNIHTSYFTLLANWKPSSFLKRVLKKNGMLCFVFEERCEAEKILLILKQKKDSNPVIDSTVTFSWVIDLETRQLYTHDIMVSSLPPTLVVPSLSYPSKAYLEQFTADYPVA